MNTIALYQPTQMRMTLQKKDLSQQQQQHQQHQMALYCRRRRHKTAPDTDDCDDTEEITDKFVLEWLLYGLKVNR